MTRNKPPGVTHGTYALLLVVYVEEMHGPPSHTRVRFAARLRARSVCTDTSRPTVCLCPVWRGPRPPVVSIRCRPVQLYRTFDAVKRA